ncbi:MAG: ABC transporter permease [Bryobacteraceae bacterium]|nr:ABC transporter permease [Bryobacteraceae bacterium]
MKWSRILEIVRKELRQTLREPRMRAILIFPPLMQSIIFGFAVNLDVEHARIAWFDNDNSPHSRDLLSRFQGSNYFDVAEFPASASEVQTLLDLGDVIAAVNVLPHFAADLERGRTTSVQVLVDGSNSNSASIVSGYANTVIQQYSTDVLRERQRERLVAQSAPVKLAVPTVRAQSRAWFNPELRSRNYFVPGVLVNIVMLVTLMLTALAIVREKEIGTMEQLMVTPIRPVELILGKTLPFAVVGLSNMVLITTVALVVFRVPLRGSPLFLVVCVVLYLMTTLGSGLFLSTVSNTQQQAMMGSFFFFLPAFMFSGFAFPIRNMPEPAQWIAALNPVRYMMEIVRGLFLKGVGLETLWPQTLALAAFGLAILGLSAARFRKTLD